MNVRIGRLRFYGHTINDNRDGHDREKGSILRDGRGYLHLSVVGTAKQIAAARSEKERARAKERSFGTVVKGHWALGPASYRSLWWSVTVGYGLPFLVAGLVLGWPVWALVLAGVMSLGLAVGGEDGMFQFELRLPLLFRGAIGFRLPRRWQGWIYERREWAIEYHGSGLVLLFAYDDRMADMADYYARSNERVCECDHRETRHKGATVVDVMESGAVCSADYAYQQPCSCTGFVYARMAHGRVELWPGWRVRLPPISWLRWKKRMLNRVLGPVTTYRDEIKTVAPVEVPLPEGPYRGSVVFYREVVRRPRSPRKIRDGLYGTFKTDDGVWMPWPGKGENSYDCGDDGMQEHTCEATTVAQVVASTVGMVLRYRERYGRHDWQPEAVGVMRD